ncbi:MAG: cytochrome c oxidase subunit 3, partial [Alphaproteobacteria bacterium]|nr:cytochrome c oxidase subunit 3 [Alphaproteobacteria bacterium]
MLGQSAIFISNDGSQGLYIGIIELLLISAVMLASIRTWWLDVLNETTVVENKSAPNADTRMRVGVAVVILLDALFLAAIVWSARKIEVLQSINLPLLMTMILLLSVCAVIRARQTILEGNRKESANALMTAALLGMAFTFFQAYEYGIAMLYFKDDAPSSAFYLATGIHSIHALAGSIFLAVCAFRSLKGRFTPQSHFAIEAGVWYWNFV